MNMKRLLWFSFIIAIIYSAPCSGKAAFRTENISSDTVKNTIVFISDTQSPMWFEKLFIKSHRNEEATNILLNTIECDPSVSSVFMLGDMTAMSSFNSNWTTIDSFLTHLKVCRIRAYAAAGNHDYLLSSDAGEANLKKRFPDFIKTGYTIRNGSLAVVLLNSNFGKLNDSEKTLQKQWYIHELDSLEQDSTVKIVIVGCHHPPYSNSNIVGHSQEVREDFVPPFMNSGKCRLFISGHAHTFQYFKDTAADKHFLVIGGGGGLLHTLSTEETSGLQDQIQWDAEYRMFHFVTCIQMASGLQLKVMMMTEEITGPQSAYELYIPLNSR